MNKYIIRIAIVTTALLSLGIADTNIERIQVDAVNSFKKFTESIRSKDVEFVECLHPRSIRGLRTVLSRHIREQSQKDSNFMSVTGLPSDFENLTDAEFAKLVYSKAMQASPESFEFPEWKMVHVVGVLGDGADIVMVFRLPSENEGFSEPTAMTLGYDIHTIKIVSIVFARNIIDIWNKQRMPNQPAPSNLLPGREIRSQMNP